MPAAPPPPDEAARLAALRSYAILDTESEEAFEDLVALAAEVTGAPVALVSLVDERRQWFKAARGLSVREMPREMSFCAHAVLQPGEALSVTDAESDPRFADNPLVTGEPHLRSYLGVPMVSPEGQAIGTFCIADHVPREHDSRTVETVRRLARAALANLELRRALRRESVAALTDPLTGLANRRAVFERLGALLEFGEPCALISLDLDHLKEANDAHGHEAGDELLRAAAERLRASLRPGDLACRVGGDEFAAILPGVPDHATAAAVARRIGERLNQPVPHGTRLLRLGATMGVAVAPRDANAPQDLLRLADEALVRAKREGRGAVGLARPEDAGRVAREARLLQTLSEEGPPLGLGPYYQPVLALRTGAVLAVEALARWSEPRLGEVAPAEMFAAASRMGRAGALSRHVRRQAFAGFARLRLEGLAPPRLALNLSAAELLADDVARDLTEEAEAAGLDLASLDIEVTEDALHERVAHATFGALAALRGRGARIVLDDFGRGSAGLSPLLRVALDGIKLDRSFTQRLGTDGQAEKLVEGAVALCHSLGLAVTAEGVETAGQERRLRAMGCDAAQGFLHAPALHEAALAAWLAARQEQAVTALRAAG